MQRLRHSHDFSADPRFRDRDPPNATAARRGVKDQPRNSQTNTTPMDAATSPPARRLDAGIDITATIMRFIGPGKAA